MCKIYLSQLDQLNFDIKSDITLNIAIQDAGGLMRYRSEIKSCQLAIVVFFTCSTKLNIKTDSFNETQFIIISSYKRVREMFYLTTHSTHFIYGYMASDIWLRTILIVRKETHCRHISYSYRLTARILLYAPSQTG